MDDTFESPGNAPPKLHPSNSEVSDDDKSSGDEDGGLDWSKLPSGTSSRPVIPKRGEKEFEPAPGGGSGLQSHVLDRARCAMFDVLKATRSTSSKTISYAIWSPTLVRAYVTLARGTHFSTIGHSVPRSRDDETRKTQKRLELLPEETIYLIERGALYCSKEGHGHRSEGIENGEGNPPMSVQQAFAELIGSDGLSLEKYQVYAYMKRLGYVVTRAEPPSSHYPRPQSPPRMAASSHGSLLQKLFSFVPSWLAAFKRLFAPSIDWWSPVRLPRRVERDRFYSSIFSSMRFLRCGHRIPLAPSADARPSSAYRVFFNVYKPSTAFKKTSPPAPDFQLVVVDAQTTPIPSIHELTALFDDAPVLPPPVPRRKRAQAPVTAANATAESDRASFVRRLFPSFVLGSSEPAVQGGQKPNPFVVLKAGRKQVVVAAVDSGHISFFRFGEGAFEDWPIV